MADVVNLSRARKERERLKKRSEADANAIKFGRTMAEVSRDDKTADKARRDLDGHRRDTE